MEETMRTLRSALLSALVVVVALSAVAEKRTVGVFEFNNTAGELESWASGLEAKASNALEAELVKLGYFTVIERGQLERIMQEQAMGLTGAMDASTAARVGQLAGCQLAVFGDIVSVSAAETFNDWSEQMQLDVSVEISVKIVNTETGEIEATSTQRDKKTKPITDADPGGQLTKCVDDVMTKIARDIYNAFPLEGIIIDMQGKRVYIDIGSNDGVAKKQRYLVYMPGRPIVHPTTGETMRGPDIEVGEIEITEVQATMSVAKIKKGKDNIRVGYRIVAKEKKRGLWEALDDIGN
jgi:hypothetical protein